MTTPIKVVFACRNFDSMAGGIERMATNIMNSLVDRGFDVSLITWDTSSAIAHYPLHPSISCYKLVIGSPFTTSSWLQLLKRQLRIRSLSKKIRLS